LRRDQEPPIKRKHQPTNKEPKESIEIINGKRKRSLCCGQERKREVAGGKCKVNLDSLGKTKSRRKVDKTKTQCNGKTKDMQSDGPL
jgi:hypothetical protein